LADVSVEHGVEIPGTSSIHLQWKLPAVSQVDGTVAVLSTAGSDGYYHWLFDTLPRIEILRRSGIPLDSIDKFIVNSYSLPFQQETLTTLGIPATKIIESCNYPHVKASRLVVPSLPGTLGNMPDWACKFLKQEFLPDRIVERSHKSERLYISRDKAKGRKIVNSHEVTNFLSKLGFKCVVLESLSIAETALLFSAAEVVLAPHGAGLSNLVFCQPGTKVIEFLFHQTMSMFFIGPQQRDESAYYYLLGEGKRPSEYFDPNKVRENILVILILYQT
jgi:capsular polysaccharide biosynthesis protein